MSTRTREPNLIPIDRRNGVPDSWPSAGIRDSRAFTAGNSTLIHRPTHFGPNTVRGACGIVRHIIETDRPAYWSAEVPNCPRCHAEAMR